MLQESFSNSLDIQNEARTVEEALLLTEEKRPELIFLDVELDGGSAFDFLERVNYRDFKIIFTTAHETYALKAFKVNATDYLLKPFSPSELKNAVEKVTTQPSLKAMDGDLRFLIEYMTGNRSKIALPVQAGFEFVATQDIIRMEAEGNYTKFYLKGGSNILISKTLKIYEGLLEDDGFCRVHAAHLVNLKEIKQYVKGEGGYVIMTDGSKVDVSRSKKDEFISRLRL